MYPSQNDNRIPTAERGDMFIPARRRFLKRAIRAAVVAPFWTIACDRNTSDRGQGKIQMPTIENPAADKAAPTQAIPLIDTRIAPVLRTATFAMG